MPAQLPAGVTLAGFRAVVGVSADDELALTNYLAGAADMAAAFTRRVLVAEQGPGDAPVTKTFRAEGREFLRVPDLRELTAINADGLALEDGFELLTFPPQQPGPAAQIRLPLRAQTVAVTGRFGFDELPPMLIDAIYAHGARNYNERNALFADSMDTGQGGAMYSYFRQLPARVRAVYRLFQVASDWYGL